VLGEHWVAITHDGGWEAMESDDGIEERLRDRGRRIWVAQCDEVGML
jgi:hypothetical protein